MFFDYKTFKRSMKGFWWERAGVSRVGFMWSCLEKNGWLIAVRGVSALEIKFSFMNIIIYTLLQRISETYKKL